MNRYDMLNRIAATMTFDDPMIEVHVANAGKYSSVDVYLVGLGEVTYLGKRYGRKGKPVSGNLRDIYAERVAHA